MIDTRRSIPKRGSRPGGRVDPGAAIPEPPLTAAEMAVAAKRERERKAKLRAQRRARKRNRG